MLKTIVSLSVRSSTSAVKLLPSNASLPLSLPRIFSATSNAPVSFFILLRSKVILFTSPEKNVVSFRLMYISSTDTVSYVRYS